MTAVAERTSSWFEQFKAQKSRAPWTDRLRKSAFERFSTLGFPATRDEDWRFTNVAPIARTQFEYAPAATADPQSLTPFTGGIRLIFVNGRFQAPASTLPEGLAAGILADDVNEHLARYATFQTNAFVALNTAFLGDAASVRIGRDAVIDEPIQLIYITVPGAGPVASHPRTLIVVEGNAKCTLVETYVGTGAYFTNAVTEIVAEAGASVDHYKIQQESLSAFHVATLQTELGRGAVYSTTSISLGGSLVRNNSNVRLAEGSDATLNGLYLARGTQHVDNQLTVDHAKPNASSQELYKGILDDRATAAFNGRILVRRDAQKTHAKQTNKNLILSDDAVVNTKPELQILADDVRCTHGATIGQLDPEAAFYLQSRGIGIAEARRILTYAFAQDVVDRIKVPELRNSLEQIIFGRLYGSSR